MLFRFHSYFNSRPCERGFGADRAIICRTDNFNSRPCERGFCSGNSGLSKIFPFQFTPLREGLLYWSNRTKNTKISIHAPARGASEEDEIVRAELLFQFTPLREGLLASAVCRRRLCISIHAPARGASNTVLIVLTAFLISIHAPARGASKCQFFFVWKPIFQFTPLREGLQSFLRTIQVRDQISIHAPAIGASIVICDILIDVVFQFTPLREGFLINMQKLDQETDFNSRPCERGFQELQIHSVFFPISIHAPARGASNDSIRTHERIYNFNSRPCERGFNSSSGTSSWPFSFQFTPLREGLHQVTGMKEVLEMPFQFTPLREGLPECGNKCPAYSHFNSRPCERGFCLIEHQINIGKKFQFTPLREGLHKTLKDSTIKKKFQFTPLREGLLLAIVFIVITIYFNSRPCERGFGSGRILFCSYLISIHAPARGASSL